MSIFNVSSTARLDTSTLLEISATDSETVVVTSGVAIAAQNDFGYGFTLIDSTLDSSKEWAIDDTIIVFVEPLELNALEGGRVYPDKDDSRSNFLIDSNDANTITAKPGSDMTTVSAIGEIFRAQYIQELSEGYDGIFIDGMGEIPDQFIAFDPSQAIKPADALYFKI